MHHPRHASILVIGDPERWIRVGRDALKGALQGLHMGWSLTANPRSTVEEAIAYLDERSGVGVVWVQEPITVEEAGRLARRMTAYPGDPWVVLDAEMPTLEPIFMYEGVQVYDGPIERGIQEQWIRASRAEERAAGSR